MSIMKILPNRMDSSGYRIYLVPCLRQPSCRQYTRTPVRTVQNNCPPFRQSAAPLLDFLIRIIVCRPVMVCTVLFPIPHINHNGIPVCYYLRHILRSNNFKAHKHKSFPYDKNRLQRFPLQSVSVCNPLLLHLMPHFPSGAGPISARNR